LITFTEVVYRYSRPSSLQIEQGHEHRLSCNFR